MLEANSAKRASLSCSVSVDLDIQVLLKELGLIGEQLGQQRGVIDREVVTVVVADNSGWCRSRHILCMAWVHQGLPLRHANQQRRGYFGGSTFRAGQCDADD